MRRIWEKTLLRGAASTDASVAQVVLHILTNTLLTRLGGGWLQKQTIFGFLNTNANKILFISPTLFILNSAQSLAFKFHFCFLLTSNHQHTKENTFSCHSRIARKDTDHESSVQIPDLS